MQFRRSMLRPDLWRYVYLLEYYPTDSATTPTKSFAFGVPPETEELSLGMRKTETKTFGGMVIDDYGVDNTIRISLSGSSINNDLRLIFRPRGISSYLTGEQEIFTFKRFLEDIKQRDKLGGKCLLYDLSKHSEKANRQFNGLETFCWQVYPGDLRIKRNKDKPFVYTYSIDFTAFPHDSAIVIRPRKKKPPVIEVLTWFDKLMAWLNNMISKITNVMKATLKYIKAAKDLVKNIRQKIQMVKNAIKAIANGFTDLISKTYSAVMELANETLALYHDVTGGVVDLGIEIADYASSAALGMVKELTDLAVSCKAIATPNFYLKEGALHNLNNVENQLSEMISKFEMKGHYVASTVSMELKSTDFMRENILDGDMGADVFLDDNIHNIPSDINSDDESSDTDEIRGDEGTHGMSVGSSNNAIDNKEQITKVYGAKACPIEDGESFESIAISEWGDVSKAPLLAKINDASSMAELKTQGKDRIIIPVLTPPATGVDNKIIGFSWQRDDYGVDIALDDKGCMHFNKEGTDFELIGGKDNLAQAILDRLKESVKKRVLQQYYGIISTLPDGPLGNAYILTSIIQTLKMEPRIKDILGVSFKGAGDSLWIEIHYIDIGGNETNFRGLA